MKRHSLPFLLHLLATTLSFAATPVAPPAIAPAPEGRSRPALVAHGSGYVALWLDSNGVVAARLDGEGRLATETPSLVATRPYYFGWADDPALASNGRTLLAAWTCGTGRGEICTGVLDPATLALKPGPTLPGRDPAIAWSGSSWTVVAYDYPAYGVPSLVRVAWLRENGDLAATFSIGEGSDPAIASNGTETIVAWRGEAYGSIRIRRVSEGGPGGEAVELPNPAGLEAFHPLLATDGNSFLVAWNHGGFGAYASRVALDVTGQPQAVPLGVRGTVDSLTWDGRDYVAGLTEYRLSYPEDPGDAHLARLSATGETKETMALAGGEGRQSEARVASNGGTAIAAWVNARSPRFGALSVPSVTIETARVTADRVLGPTVISLAAAAQILPAVAAHASMRLAAWTDVSAGIARVRFTLFDAALAPVGPAGRAARQTTSDQRYPAVATDGSQFLLAWTETAGGAPAGTLYGLLVGPAGDPGTPFVIAQGVAHSPLAMVHDGTSYYVVWTAHDGTLAGCHVSTAGSVMESSPIGFGEQGINPAIAWSGCSFLLAWEALEIHPECRITCVPVSRIRALPLTANGSRAAGVETLPFQWTEHPAVVWTGTTFVLFADNRYYLPSYPLTVPRFTSEGAPLEPATIAWSGDHPAAGYDGTSILLLWSGRDGDHFRMSLTPELAMRLRPTALGMSPQCQGTSFSSVKKRAVAVSGDGSVMMYPLCPIDAPFLGSPALVIDDAPRLERRRVIQR